jgi:hypothetical protein
MGMDVYANGMAIACKAADGKTIAAFPDVCFTPPLTPATPPGVPIPYPNTAMASDTTNGTKTVMIAGQEVMLKNISVFKTSTGDEAGCAPKKGVVTSQIKGKANFICWSMDVKFEGENVPRHLDLTGHNEASAPPNTPPWPYLDKMAFGGTGSCGPLATTVADKCGKFVKKTKKGKVKRKPSLDGMCKDPECKEARKCVLTPYSPSNCCDGQTPHHIVPKSQFKKIGEGGASLIKAKPGYNANKAPCICVDGSNQAAELHGEIHAETSRQTRIEIGIGEGQTPSPTARWPYAKAEEVGAKAVETATKNGESPGCSADCVQTQLSKGHADMGVKPGHQIRPTTPGPAEDPVNGFTA